MKKHTEDRLEDAIEHQFIKNDRYQKGTSDDYDSGRALEPDRVLAFIQQTQDKQWQTLKGIHGNDTGKVVLDDLCKTLGTQGMLNVLRHGFKCYGRKLKVAFFAPSTRLNPDTLAQYKANTLSVTRQLYFATNDKKSLDMVLFLNGLPVITMELKNPLSGQTVEDAKHQYKTDRDPKQKLFEFRKRALVHFAVDQDLVFMTTRLSGAKTFFLPFNLGANGGAGNPPAADAGYRTAYLWREVLQSDSLMDILGRFMHLQVEDKKVLTDKGIKKIRKETMIFPRYHQLDSVRKLVRHSKAHGAGRNYLVEHSAGSGKSNSIAWLAHRLSSLHDADDKKIFDTVVVITDRRVLDQQLQDTIYQFEHKQGVVQKIDEDTRQLVTALQIGTPIIISTVQKFPFVTETIDKINKEMGEGSAALSTKGKRFAVIVDEAHSSQSGETAMELKYVLNREGIREVAEEYKGMSDEEIEDAVIQNMLKRGRQPNISFYAFTATPKYKTKKIFDEPGSTSESPFHKYSMRQAIEERFIFDVLENYTTYETYFRITQTAEDDPNVERKKAARSLARFLTLHPYNLRQKTEVMVEHFRASVRHKIGGRAKAMVVTDSRLAAVKYKLMFDEYLKEKDYTDIKTLVAFSGTVEDPELPGKKYTEVGMNGGVSERELPEVFDTEEYRVLLVAEKYQTGFDQPYLHTMYVDKLLAGIQAVQTLSRLNRMATGKEDTFVLDFRNKREDIFKAFKPYYEGNEAEELTDPHHMYRIQGQIEEKQFLREKEIGDFCTIYFAPKRKESVHDHARINGILDLAVERFKTFDETDQEEIKSLFVNFRNMYAFLSQVIPYQDSDLEKLYTYLRFLLTKLPRRASGSAYHLENEIELEYYRLQKISEGSIDLHRGEAQPLKGPGEVGTGQPGDDEIRLSELIVILNERFGTDFTEADQLFFDQIEAEAKEDDNLRQAAKVNSMADFLDIFKKMFEGLVIDRMEGNEDIFGRLMSDPEFRGLAQDNLGQKLYRVLAKENLSEEDQIKLLIPKGESRRLEFKETFSLDVKTGTKEKYIEKSALKTIGAFLNTEGGDLLIGVNDDEEVTGIDDEIKKFYKNEDKYLLNFKNHIKSKVGEGFYPLLDYKIVEVNGKNVLRVNCGIASTPCFLEDKEFYVRSGPSTDLLEGKKQHEYIQARFHSSAGN